MARTNFSIKPLIHFAPHKCKHTTTHALNHSATATEPQSHNHHHLWSSSGASSSSPSFLLSHYFIKRASERAAASATPILFISSNWNAALHLLPPTAPQLLAANFACCPLLRKFYSCLPSVCRRGGISFALSSASLAENEFWACLGIIQGSLNGVLWL